MGASSAGFERGARGPWAAGTLLMTIAVEQSAPRGSGQTRILLISDPTCMTIRDFLLTNIEPVAVVSNGCPGFYQAPQERR